MDVVATRGVQRKSDLLAVRRDRRLKRAPDHVRHLEGLAVRESQRMNIEDAGMIRAEQEPVPVRAPGGCRLDGEIAPERPHGARLGINQIEVAASVLPERGRHLRTVR
ncbi:hypothetical protein D3C86_1727130 [compost metagenome]